MLFQWIDLQRGMDTEQGRVGRVSSMYSLNVSRVIVSLVSLKSSCNFDERVLSTFFVEILAAIFDY